MLPNPAGMPNLPRAIRKWKSKQATMEKLPGLHKMTPQQLRRFPRTESNPEALTTIAVENTSYRPEPIQFFQMQFRDCLEAAVKTTF
jgi:hypothetical protein